MYDGIWTNGLGQHTLNQGFMDQKCLVHHEDKWLECTMKHQMIDHEPMNHGAWTKDFEYTKELGPTNLNGKIECTWYG